MASFLVASDLELTIMKYSLGALVFVAATTRGHGTHSLPAIWKGYLAEFMRDLPPQ